MVRLPDKEEIRELSEFYYFDLTELELELVHQRVEKNIQDMERFLESAIEEAGPPSSPYPRNVGYRPSQDEDPLNAFVRKCHIQGADSGLLSGKTVAFKDHISVAGVPLSFGSHFMDGYIPDFDATITTRLLDHGATIIGKLNMGDFSNGGTNFGMGDFGRVLNPHRLNCVTGGSSTGAAAAVAGGYADIAIGGDQGGSIRIPGAWSGVVGLKATEGLIPSTGTYGSDPSVDYVGPMARSVIDVAKALQCMAGIDGFDPKQAHVPAIIPDYVQHLDKGVKGLRIGILIEGFDIEGMQSDVRDAVMNATDLFVQNGATVKHISVPAHREAAALAFAAITYEGSKHLFETNFAGALVSNYYPASLMTSIGRFKKSHGYELPIFLKQNILTGAYLHGRYHGRLYAKGQNARRKIREQYDRVLAETDLLIMPTVPTTAPVYRQTQGLREALEETLFLNATRTSPASLRGANVRAFNLTGHPAITVPCGKSDGLPIGLQLVGRHFEEATLLQAAYAVEQLVAYEHLPLPVSNE